MTTTNEPIKKTTYPLLENEPEYSLLVQGKKEAVYFSSRHSADQYILGLPEEAQYSLVRRDENNCYEEVYSLFFGENDIPKEEVEN